MFFIPLAFLNNPRYNILIKFLFFNMFERFWTAFIVFMLIAATMTMTSHGKDRFVSVNDSYSFTSQSFAQK